MNCERCECRADGVYLLQFADASHYFRLCSDCLDLYRHAIHDEEEEDFEDVTDPCEVEVVEIVESAEDPE